MSDRQEEPRHLQNNLNEVEFKEFIQRLADEDSSAINDFLEKYTQQLLRLANKNIHPRLLKRFDGQDVVQSVFRTFFRRQKSGDLEVNGAEQLWKLLVRITVCKTRSQARRHSAQRRDARTEAKLESGLAITTTQASPEEALAFWEEVEIVLEGLPAKTPEILNGRLEGKSKTDIAEELDLSRQTIHRILNLLEKRLMARLSGISQKNQ